MRAALRGLPEEDGQAAGGVEVADVEGGRRGRVAFARWRKGLVPGRLSLEVDLGGCRAADALVGLEDGGVEEPEADPVLEVVPKEAAIEPEMEQVLEAEPEAFDERDGAFDELVASGSPRPM